MNRFVRKYAVMELKKFDGSCECAHAIISWAKAGVRSATTSDGELLLLVEGLTETETIVKSGDFVGMDYNASLCVLTSEEFEEDFIEV